MGALQAMNSSETTAAIAPAPQQRQQRRGVKRGHERGWVPTPRQRAWLRALAEGAASPTEAARRAGYADPVKAAYDNRNNAALIAWNREQAAAAGLDDHAVWVTLADLLEAETVRRFVLRDGSGSERVAEFSDPDGRLQLATAVTVARLLGMWPGQGNRQANVAVQVMAAAAPMADSPFEGRTGEDLMAALAALAALAARREAILALGAGAGT
jgi:hypothetical protein